MGEFARIWQAAEKIVYSTTLVQATTKKTRIERSFDADEVGRIKAAATGDLNVGGPALAADAFRAGLVGECHFFLAPIVVGGGKRALPDAVCLELDLLDQRRFEDGMVWLHYATQTATARSRR